MPLRTLTGALALAVAGLLARGALAPASAETIRVVIADGQRTVNLSSDGGLVEGAGERTTARSASYSAGNIGSRTVRIRPQRGHISVNGKAYRGSIELRRNGNGRLQVVNVLDIEEYLRGVVAAEIPSTWDSEALKTQAIAARTYALYQKRNAGRRSYHLPATVDGQMYLGLRGERRRSTEAVEATRGIVLTYDGEVIAAFYHSSCGGHTEDASALWGVDEPYLKGVDCDCQNISTYGLWEKRFAAATVARALRRGGYRLATIDGIDIGSLTAAGRVRNVLLRHAGRTTTVPAEALRSSLGYTKVPSIFFEPEVLEGEVVLSGRGLGHGVGLCQWGAKEMADRGIGHREILLHYYPGTVLSRIDG